MFDSLAYIRKLEGAGVSRDQAEVQAEAMVKAMTDSFATRDDVGRVELSLRTDFAKLRSEFAELKGDFAELRIEFAGLKGEFAKLRVEFEELKTMFIKLEAKVDSLETRLVLKLGGLMIGLFTIGSAVMGYIIKHG